MSLITRCPACETMFKVVTDQLKVSQGWVRCGQCAEVFDAQLHLQPTPAAMPADGSISSPLGDGALDVPMANYSNDGSLEPSYEQEVMAALQARGASASESAVSSAIVSTPDGVDPYPGTRLHHSDRNDDRLSPINDALVEPTPDSSGDALNSVSFVRDARRQAFWRRPLVRSLLGLIAVSLIGLLGLQLTLQHRDALLVFEPRLKPWLEVLCEPLGCQLGAPRRIDAIVIDSSSFNKADGTGTYRLSFTLKNTGTSVVAMPSLELSLTDSQDQAVIRRVLSPEQFSAANGRLTASGEHSHAMTLQVLPAAPALRIVGYRLLAFYP